MVCLIIVVKPGASFFYLKQILDKQEFVQDAGFAFRYKLRVNPLIHRIQGSLLFEDGQPLTPSQDNLVVKTGNGNYSLVEAFQGDDYLYFSSSDNSDPRTNNRGYTIYLPFSFISRPLGAIYLIILLPGLAWFLVFTLAHPEHRHTITGPPRGILSELNLFLDLVSHTLRSFISKTWQRAKTRATFWKQSFTITVLVAYFYIFMEWIFFATMPSFMSILSISNMLDIFLLSGLLLALASTALIVLFIIVDTLALSDYCSHITSYLRIVIPTFILSALALLLIDNFSYTVFNFGISTSSGVWRVAYGLLFISLLVLIYTQMLNVFHLRAKEISEGKYGNRLFYVSLSLLAISFVLAGVSFSNGKINPAYSTGEIRQATSQPNILLLGSDGMNADYLSVYGYYRDTTPR